MLCVRGLSILRKIIPGTKNFAKVLKNSFMPSESFFESLVTPKDIDKKQEKSWFEVTFHKKKANGLHQAENFVMVAFGCRKDFKMSKEGFNATQFKSWVNSVGNCKKQIGKWRNFWESLVCGFELLMKIYILRASKTALRFQKWAQTFFSSADTLQRSNLTWYSKSIFEIKSWYQDVQLHFIRRYARHEGHFSILTGFGQF